MSKNPGNSRVGCNSRRVVIGQFFAPNEASVATFGRIPSIPRFGGATLDGGPSYAFKAVVTFLEIQSDELVALEEERSFAHGF